MNIAEELKRVSAVLEQSPYLTRLVQRGRSDALAQLGVAMTKLSEAFETVGKSGNSMLRAFQVLDRHENQLEWLSNDMKRTYDNLPSVTRKVAEAWDAVRSLKMDLSRVKI